MTRKPKAGGKPPAAAAGANDQIAGRSPPHLRDLTAEEISAGAEEGRRRLVKLHVEEQYHRYKKTNNPLYQWKAIRSLLEQGEPLPPWATEFILHVAIEICTLTDRCLVGDVREHRDTGAYFGDGGSFRESPITPPVAMGLVCQKLGLTREGKRWNAFRDYVDDLRFLLDADRADGEKLDLLPPTRACADNSDPPESLIEIVVKERELLSEDASEKERVVRRRVARGRELRWPPGHIKRRVKKTPLGS